MAGYRGHSMSNNAIAAYSDGQMPISRWSKSALLERAEEYGSDEGKIAALRRLTAQELKKALLRHSGWHHTGAFYACTDFYELDLDALEAITLEDIERTISSRSRQRRRRTAEELAADKAAKAARAAERASTAEKERLFMYQNRYKTMGGFMRSSSVDLDQLRKIRLQRIQERREQLRKTWEAQNYAYGLERIQDDDFIEGYIVR